METISRINRRAAWLALVAAAFAAPARAQTNNDDLLPARPLAAPHWPEFAPPADPSKPDPAKSAATTTSANLPAFSGFGAGGNAPKAGAFPQPGINAPATTDTNPGKVWTVAGQDKPASPPERTPRDFGNGWKNFVSNKMAGRPGPAAALAAPRSTSTPRPEWNWHGYDSYNVNRATASELPAANSPSNAADLAPFMKYAHLWRPATLAGGTHTASNNQSGGALGVGV